MDVNHVLSEVLRHVTRLSGSPDPDIREFAKAVAQLHRHLELGGCLPDEWRKKERYDRAYNAGYRSGIAGCRNDGTDY